MTLPEAAAILGLKITSLRSQVYNGALKAKKIGRDWQVTPAEVERYRTEHLGRLGGRGVPRKPRPKP